MRSITIQKSNSDSLLAQLGILYSVFKEASKDEQLEFDLSLLDWVCPLLLLPLAAYMRTTGSTAPVDHYNVSSYLKSVSFPNGVDSVSSFEKQLQQEKNYIPISVLIQNAGADRERLESLFADMILKSLNAADIPGIMNAVYYPITELATNVFEHSKSNHGFVFGQFYPKKNYLDICIVDCGRGLRASYEQDKNLFISDLDAITEAMRGHSTKPDKERGYGVSTSKRVVCEGLNGEFILLSGSGVLVAKNTSERIASLPNFNWQGVIIAYRIPKPKAPIDISPFLE
ncbi:MAG: hypothetical protein AAB657_00820 [Patescibacteria group bacterium]